MSVSLQNNMYKKDLKLQPESVGRGWLRGTLVERGAMCSQARSPNIAKNCSSLLYFDLGGKEGGLVCEDQLLSRSGRKGGADLREQGRRGCCRGLPRGVPSAPALGGCEGRSALLPPAAR